MHRIALPTGLRLALLCLALAAAGCAQAARPAPKVLNGIVTKVVDGDTLIVQPSDGAALHVRLRDIDAPESCQAWGTEARLALEELALGKPAQLRPRGHDPYGRTVAAVSVDGEDVAARMVVEGHAWSIRTRWDTGPLVKQERQARALGRGLHATAGAVQPKEFRRTHGACGRPSRR